MSLSGESLSGGNVIIRGIIIRGNVIIRRIIIRGNVIISGDDDDDVGSGMGIIFIPRLSG